MGHVPGEAKLRFRKSQDLLQGRQQEPWWEPKDKCGTQAPTDRGSAPHPERKCTSLMLF